MMATHVSRFVVIRVALGIPECSAGDPGPHTMLKDTDFELMLRNRYPLSIPFDIFLRIFLVCLYTSDTKGSSTFLRAEGIRYETHQEFLDRYGL